MSQDNLTTQYVSSTYQRLLQLSDNGNYVTDGTGSKVNILPVTASWVLNGGGGNVTKVIAGSGISVSPSSGVGDVTVINLGAAYNTMTGSYGSFYDTGSYLASSGTTVYSMSLSTTDISNGVFISGSTNPYNTYIKFTNAGVYNLQFSAQFSNSDAASAVDTHIWIRKNDLSSANDIPDSAGTVSVPPAKGGSNGQTIASWNYYINAAADDFIQILWHTATPNRITLETLQSGSSPVHPRSPSLILTANRIDTFLSNTGSFTGSFTGSLFGTSSVATVANNVSIIANNTTNSTYYIPFTDRLAGTAQTGSVQLQTDTGISYNPFANSITISQLNGNALTANNATNATTAATASSVARLNQNVIITGSLTVVTGSSIELQVTNTGVTIGNNITDNHTVTGSLSVSGSITGSLFGTASWATNALTASFLPVGTYNITSSWAIDASTASFTPNALVTASVSSNVLTFTKGNGTTFNLTVDTGSGSGGGGGGGTPGGGNTSIQFRSGSTFSGNTRLTYQYDTLSATSNRLYHEYNEDFRSNRFTTDYRGSYLPNNTYGGIKQYAGISHWSYQLAANAPKSPIYAFDAQGGTPGNLSMHGFKCDYSLLLFDGSSKVASRVGTLIGAWSYDTAIAPVIQDNYVDGDLVYNELGTVLFTLAWSGGDIVLEMDCTSVNSGTTYFNGLFTNFGNGL